MFAVLETKRSGAQNFQTHDTIAIAGADGFAVARASFMPRSIPPIFDAATVVQPEAYVAAGAVYYVDGGGVVRRIDPSGTVRAVTTFPLTSPEQELSFAVSPDGQQLMAARLTFPKLTTPSSGPPPTPTGNWVLDVLKASAGGAATQVQHLQAPPDKYPGGPGGFETVFVVGWDNSGPIGLIGAGIGTQQNLFDGQRFFGGHLAYLGADGRTGQSIGGQDCQPFAPPTAGRVICAAYAGQAISVSVRGLDAHTIWSGSPASPPSGFLGGFVLSPDGQRLAMDGQIITLANNATTPLPGTFTPAAFLGSDQLIGLIQGGQVMATVHLTSSPTLENWGFSGQTVGSLGS
jgi:hypothetical protein